MKIAQILLRAYLRRNPVHLRLNQFNFFSRYAWLKNVLEELKPELFPQGKQDEEKVLVPETPPETPAEVYQLLEQQWIQGLQGTYQVEQWLGARGTGQLFLAQQKETGQPVVVKEYLLRPDIFNAVEAGQRQQQFTNQALLQLADGRSHHFRVVTPREAIADSHAHERCYLITPAVDASPTLRQKLAQRQEPLPAIQVRSLVDQLLQSLDFLHRQKFRYANGRVQAGLSHGRLDADHVLWVEAEATNQASQEPFLYFCDFTLWEQLFEPPQGVLDLCQISPGRIRQELQDIGRLGTYLCWGRVEEALEAPALIQATHWPGTDPDLERFLQRLLDPVRSFVSAEAARQALLKLPPLYDNGPVVMPPPVVDKAPPKKSRIRWLALLSTLVILGGIGWKLRPKTRSIARRPPNDPTACCLAEVSAVPAGTFHYTAVEAGAWQYVIQQSNLLRKGQTFRSVLEQAHPDLTLKYRPSSSIEKALEAVKRKQVDFAIVPLLKPLPINFATQTVAYDGLAIVVPFSYAERRKSLPAELKGELSLQDVEELYTGVSNDWQDFGAESLPIQRLAPLDPEAVGIFESEVIAPLSLGDLEIAARQTTLPEFQQPTLKMLRSLIRGFEGEGSDRIGRVGFSTLSRIRGQCSVYPLAIRGKGRRAVQPWILSDGTPIDPTTDLCDRKGNYRPNVTAFKTGAYPLGYPIAVVYGNDNRSSTIGKKFAALMQTLEGQQLLSDAGLVPLEDFWSRSQTDVARQNE